MKRFLLVVPINRVFKHLPRPSAVILNKAGRVAGRPRPKAIMLCYTDVTKRSVKC